MPAAAGLLPACQRRRISEISLTSLGRTRTANRLARTLARQQADAEVSEPLMPVPELIVPTCRTAPMNSGLGTSGQAGEPSRAPSSAGMRPHGAY
jgi:hypothetical protein